MTATVTLFIALLAPYAAHAAADAKPAPARTAPAPSASPVASPSPSPSPTPSSTPAPVSNVPIVPSGTSFLDTFPQLKKYVYEEPPSGIFLGFGFSPIGLLKDKFMFTGDFFELHWIKNNWDVEILNASYAMTRGQSSEFQSTQFTFRFSPKYRFFGPISAGPLLGYELITFPGVGARIYRAPKIEPNSEPFSSKGWIYGGEVSETFQYGKGYMLKFNEVFYQETYSAKSTINGFDYYFDDQGIQDDRSKIGPGFVLLFDASLLY